MKLNQISHTLHCRWLIQEHVAWVAECVVQIQAVHWHTIHPRLYFADQVWRRPIAH